MSEKFYPKNIYGQQMAQPASCTEVELRRIKAELEYYKELADKNWDLYYQIAEDCVQGRKFGIICNDCTVTVTPSTYNPLRSNKGGW